MKTQYFVTKSKNVAIWRRIVMLVFLTGAALSISYSYKNPTSLWEYDIYIKDNSIVICYILLFAQLLITADAYSISNSQFDDYSVIYVGGKSRWTRYMATNLLLESVIIIVAFSCIIGAVYFLKYDNITRFSDEWSSRAGITANITPLIGTIILNSYLVLRVFFLGLLTMFINLLSRNSIGFIGPITITLFDRFFYDTFDIMQPFFVLPLEHTRIAYTEATAPANEFVSRPGYLISYVYWIILISIIYILIRAVVKRKNFLTQSDQAKR